MATRAQGRLFAAYEHRAGLRGMVLRKDELCPPGGYAALPLDLLARPDLSPAAKLVAAALADHVRGAATWAYPSVARLAAMVGLTPRTVRRGLRALEAADVIVCQERPGVGNVYAFLRPRTPDILSGGGGQNVRGGRTKRPQTPDILSAETLTALSTSGSPSPAGETHGPEPGPDDREAYFADLPTDRQDHYRDVARQRSTIHSPTVLEFTARLFAWADRADGRQDDGR